MSRDIPECDWKVLRRVHPIALERFCDDPKRSRAIAMLAEMRRSGLLTDAEFAGFSQGTRDTLESTLVAR